MQILLGLNNNLPLDECYCCDKNDRRLLLIDLCFLAIFQDETNFITQEFQNTAELFIYFLQLLSS